MTTILGKRIGPIGYGAMNLTWRPDPVSDEQSFATLKAALASGCNFWNAGVFYGTPEANSLQLLNRYFTKYPEDADKVVLSVKGGNELGGLHPDASAANLTRSINECLSLLDGKKSIDIFEQARQDRKGVPLEESISAMAEFVKQGKIGGIGLSEVTGDQIRANAALHPIAAVEVELSITSPDILTNGVAQVCADLGIPVVAYSPLGRGMLTAQFSKPEDLHPQDIRFWMPRFQKENFSANARWGELLRELGQRKGCTAAQVAIAWTRHWNGRPGMPLIVPIPGCTTPQRAEENGKDVRLSEAEFDEIEQLRRSVAVPGSRSHA